MLKYAIIPCMESMKNELITKEYSSGIKGWMCIGVLLHHLSMFSGLFASTYFGHFLNLLGSWTVGVFLFLSGYGLFCSYSQKGDSYIRGFFKHRFLPLYISYLVGVLIYLIYDFKTLTPLKLLTSLTWGGTIISFGWFFQFLFLMYLLFWAVFRFCGNKVARSIILGVFFTVYLFGAHLLGAHDVPVVCFACGIIMGVYRDRLARLFEKHAVILSVIF
ncbi:MAG: acyltransferase, partial [Lachnospiraceae bacterium]|nr:acyltransferase [Lachnospiraceae bacterium]